MDFHPLTHPYDVPIDFNDLFGLSHFVGGVDAIGGPVTSVFTASIHERPLASEAQGAPVFWDLG